MVHLTRINVLLISLIATVTFSSFLLFLFFSSFPSPSSPPSFLSSSSSSSSSSSLANINAVTESTELVEVRQALHALTQEINLLNQRMYEMELMNQLSATTTINHNNNNNYNNNNNSSSSSSSGSSSKTTATTMIDASDIARLLSSPSFLSPDDIIYFRAWLTRKQLTDRLQFNTKYYNQINNNKENNNTKVREQWALFKPLWRCQNTEYIAATKKSDGGKWLCDVDKLPQPCIVYSFGSNKDIDFEKGLADRAPHCEIHIFDPTVLVPPLGLPPSAKYHTVGLGAHDGVIDLGAYFPNCPIKTLKHIMNDLHHSKVDVLKVDIELSEWSVFHQWSLEGLPQIGQLQLEIHVGFDHHSPSFPLSELIFLFDLIESKGMRLFHKDPNPYCENCHEFSFVFVPITTTH